MEDGSLVATPRISNPLVPLVEPSQTPPPPPPGQAAISTQMAQQEPTTSSMSSSVLSMNTISELSAATGLPSSEIQSWAASLPAGSTVRVTHHYDLKNSASLSEQEGGSMNRGEDEKSSSSPSVVAAGSNNSFSKHSSEDPLDFLPMNHMEFLSHLPKFPTAGVAETILPRSQLSTPLNCGSVIDSGPLQPCYLESFAVDPNEVLRKDRIKSEFGYSSSSSCSDEDRNSILSNDPLGNIDYEAPITQHLHQHQEQHLHQFMTPNPSNAADSLSAFQFNLLHNIQQPLQQQQQMGSSSPFCHIKSEPNSPMSSSAPDSGSSSAVAVAAVASSPSMASLVSNYGGSSSDLSDCSSNYQNSHNLLQQQLHHAQGHLSPVTNQEHQHILSGLDMEMQEDVTSTQQLRQPLNYVHHHIQAAAAAAAASNVAAVGGSAAATAVGAGGGPEEMDLSSFQLNDQDFHSIKSIVEQTFKDGRDMLDIISAV